MLKVFCFVLFFRIWLEDNDLLGDINVGVLVPIVLALNRLTVKIVTGSRHQEGGEIESLLVLNTSKVKWVK